MVDLGARFDRRGLGLDEIAELRRRQARCPLRSSRLRLHGLSLRPRSAFGPTAHIQVPAGLISAALQTYRLDVSDLPHCGRIRTFMLAAWLSGARLTALLSPT